MNLADSAFLLVTDYKSLIVSSISCNWLSSDTIPHYPFNLIDFSLSVCGIVKLDERVIFIGA